MTQTLHDGRTRDTAPGAGTVQIENAMGSLLNGGPGRSAHLIFAASARGPAIFRRAKCLSGRDTADQHCEDR
jgi:hypothetical protein